MPRYTRDQIVDRLAQMGQQNGVPLNADDLGQMADIVEARQNVADTATAGGGFGGTYNVEVPGQGRFHGVTITPA